MQVKSTNSRLVPAALMGIAALSFSLQAGAQCQAEDLNRSWDIFFGGGPIATTQCQVRVTDNQIMRGECRYAEVPQGFSEWVKLRRGRLRLTGNCVVKGQLTIPDLTPINFGTVDTLVRFSTGRMHLDKQAIDGVLVWRDPRSPDSNPINYTGTFNAVRR